MNDDTPFSKYLPSKNFLSTIGSPLGSTLSLFSPRLGFPPPRPRPLDDAPKADKVPPIGFVGDLFAPPVRSMFFLFLNGRDFASASVPLIDDELLSSLLDLIFSCSLFDAFFARLGGSNGWPWGCQRLSSMGEGCAKTFLASVVVYSFQFAGIRRSFFDGYLNFSLISGRQNPCAYLFVHLLEIAVI